MSFALDATARLWEALRPGGVLMVGRKERLCGLELALQIQISLAVPIPFLVRNTHFRACLNAGKYKKGHLSYARP